MSKITELAEIETIADNDLIEVVDVSDTTMASSGTNKYMTKASLEASLNVYTQEQVDAKLNDPITIEFDSSGEIVPGDTYGLVWTDSVLRVRAGYGIDYIPTYTIMDNSGIEFKPAAVTWIDENNIDIDFGPITPITGEWTLMLSTGGIGGVGPQGDSTFTYVAYASDASGTGFSLTPTDELKYRAEIQVTEEILTPDADDFSAATWVKYIGGEGGGLTTYADLTTMEASTAESDGDLVWCTSLATLYQRLDAGSAYTRDGTFVCNTGSGGNTRFIGKAGAYTYAAANFKSVVIGTTPLLSAEYDCGTETSSEAVNFTNGINQKITLGGNITITLSAAQVGHYQLKLVQDATGSRTVTWGTTVTWKGATPPSLQTAAYSTDFISLYWDGSDWWGQF